MKYFRYTTILIFAILCSLLFTCCDSSGEAFRIGVSQGDDNDWFTQMNYEIEQEAKFYNLDDIEFLSAGGDSSTQIRQIKGFINGGVDAIIVTSSDPELLCPVLCEAYDKGILVVVYGEVKGEKYTSTVAMNDSLIGLIAGDKANNLLKDGGMIVELRSGNNPLNSRSVAEQIHAGFIEQVDKGIGVVSVDLTDKEDDAQRVIDSLYRLHTKIDIILSYTSEIAEHVDEKLDELNRGETSGDRPLLWSVQTRSLGSDLQMILDNKIDALFIYTPGGNASLGQIYLAHTNRSYKRNVIGATTVADKSNCGILRNQYWNLVKRGNHINKLNARIQDSAEARKQQQFLLIATTLFSLALVVLILIIVKSLIIKRQRNQDLSQQNDRITEQNKRLELERSELIRLSSDSGEEPIGQDHTFMDRVNEMIKKGLGDPNFGVDQMCSELCYSRVQVYRKVKEMTGESPIKLLRIARIKRGNYLLHNTDKSITNIAFEVGYTSSSYFSKYYKEIYGVLPSEIVREVRDLNCKKGGK